MYRTTYSQRQIKNYQQSTTTPPLISQISKEMFGKSEHRHTSQLGIIVWQVPNLCFLLRKLMSTRVGPRRRPKSMDPEKADPQSAQLSLHFKSGICQQVDELEILFSLFSSGLRFRRVGVIGFEPITVPDQINGHDDANLEVKEHEDFDEPIQLRTDPRTRQIVDEEEGGVE